MVGTPKIVGNIQMSFGFIKKQNNFLKIILYLYYILTTYDSHENENAKKSCCNCKNILLQGEVPCICRVDLWFFYNGFSRSSLAGVSSAPFLPCSGLSVRYSLFRYSGVLLTFLFFGPGLYAAQAF